MRVFWALIGVLLFSAFVLLTRGRDDGPSGRGAARAADPPPGAVGRQPARTAGEPVGLEGSSVAGASDPAAVPVIAAPDALLAEIDEVAEANPTGLPTSAEAELRPDPWQPIWDTAGADALAQSAWGTSATGALDPSTTAHARPNGAWPAEFAQIAPPGEGSYLSDLVLEKRTPADQRPAALGPAAEPALVQLDDGSHLYAGSIAIIGSGTPADPFLVPWELLTTARRVYRPDEGLDGLPAWAPLLEGKRVRLSGYMLLPLVPGGVRDLLVMDNQWDGCCIGVPPTPYDAAEVVLASSFQVGREPVNFGTIEGRFRTDPFIEGDWLLGLYVLDEAELIATDIRGEDTLTHQGVPLGP